MNNDIVPLNGHVRVRAWEKQPDGSEKQVYDKTIKNLIVNVGKESILKYLAGSSLGGGSVNGIGVGSDNTSATVSQTDLVSSSAVWKTIASGDKIFTSNTLYVSVDFGYSEAIFTWHELGLRDNQGTPVLWARQVDTSPLVKTTSKRAIIEWQLSL